MAELKRFKEILKEDVCCLTLFIMAHGNLGHIKVSNGQIDLERIFEVFDNRNCPALRGKPKLFVIQACRGGLSLITQYFVEAIVRSNRGLFIFDSFLTVTGRTHQWNAICFYPFLTWSQAVFKTALFWCQWAVRWTSDESVAAGVWCLVRVCSVSRCLFLRLWNHHKINIQTQLNARKDIQIYVFLFYLFLCHTGKLAIGYPDTGSPLLEEMNNVFSQSDSMSMFDLFTKVSTAVEATLCVIKEQISDRLSVCLRHQVNGRLEKRKQRDGFQTDRASRSQLTPQIPPRRATAPMGGPLHIVDRLTQKWYL